MTIATTPQARLKNCHIRIQNLESELASVRSAAAKEIARFQAIEKAAQLLLDETEWSVDAWKSDVGWFELQNALKHKGK